MRKKITSGILISVLISLLFSSAAFAEEGTTEIVKSIEGDVAVYSMNLTANSKINAADFVLSYDNQALQFMDMQNGPLAMSGESLLVTNHIEEEKKIYASYASLNDNKETGTILTVRFKILEPEVVENNTKPVIGVNVKDQFDYDCNEIVEKVLTWDASVAMVDEEKGITDTDANPQSLPAENNKSFETGQQKSSKQQTKQTDLPDTVDTSTGLIVGGIVLVAALTVVILLAIKNKKKNDEEI